MRRQLGAIEIDIDTMEGTAEYSHPAPDPIDWLAIREACLDAGYTLVGLRLKADGVVSQRDGQSVLRFDGNGQELPLATPAPDGPLTFEGTVEGWGGKDPHLHRE